MNLMLIHGINLAVLLTILIVVARKKLRALYQQQHDDFQARMSEASAKYDQMKSAYDKLKAEYDHLDQKMAEMRQASLREIENESSRIETEADRQIQLLIADGENRIRTEAEKLKSSLETELLERSLQAARTVLEKEISSEDPSWISEMVGSGASARGGRKNYAS